MSSKQADFLTKLRDGAQMIVDAANETLKSLTNPELGLDLKKESVAVNEATFIILKWDAQKSFQLGDFDVAYKKSNLQDKWQPAFNILRNSNDTIKERYHGLGYNYSYWVYGEDKIYRQKLKT